MAVVVCHGPPGCHASVAWINDEHGPGHRAPPTASAGRSPPAWPAKAPPCSPTPAARSAAARRSAELLDGPGDVRLVVGDLASLSAVRALADQVPDRLDVLVNNAGIGFAGGREESDDGYELRFAVNYLAGLPARRAAARPPGGGGAGADRQRRLARPGRRSTSTT